MQYTLKLLDHTWSGDNGYETIGRFTTEKTKEEITTQTERNYGNNATYGRGKKDRPNYKIIFHR